MIPRASQGIGCLAQRVAMDLIPRAPDVYAASDLGFIAMLMSMIGQDYDRAAAVLIGEHEALKPLLADAAAGLGDDDLAGRIAEALATPPASLRVPDLNARADGALALLIEAHGAVEDAAAAGAPWAAELDRRIWTFLDAFAANRAYEVPF